MLYEAVPPVGPLFIPALAALFTLAALFFAIGLLKMLDGFVRALFGTAEGIIGWVPFAGKVVKHSLHKIEQKVSHLIGRAERQLDVAVALTWHNLARLVTWMGNEIAGVAESAWRLAQQAKAFVRQKDVTHQVRAGVKPVKAQTITNAHSIHNLSSEAHALRHSVAHGVFPRIKTAEWEIEHVLEPSLANVRARTKALERGGTRLWRWLRTHPKTIATGAFIGAVSFALTKLGGGWIRCANWRKIGRRVCRMPMTDIDALIALFITAEAIANLPTIVRIMQGVVKETAEAMKDIAEV